MKNLRQRFAEEQAYSQRLETHCADLEHKLSDEQHEVRKLRYEKRNLQDDVRKYYKDFQAQFAKTKGLEQNNDKEKAANHSERVASDAYIAILVSEAEQSERTIATLQKKLDDVQIKCAEERERGDHWKGRFNSNDPARSDADRYTASHGPRSARRGHGFQYSIHRRG